MRSLDKGKREIGSDFSVLLWQRDREACRFRSLSPLEARQAYTPTIASVYINKQMIIKNEKYRKMAKLYNAKHKRMKSYNLLNIGLQIT